MPTVLSAPRTLAPTRFVERRAHERQPCELVALVECAGFESVRGVVDDVSDGGVGLSLPRPFSRGAVLTLHLRDSDKEHGTVQVQVVRATFRREVGWFLGCRFLP